MDKYKVHGISQHIYGYRTNRYRGKYGYLIIECISVFLKNYKPGKISKRRLLRSKQRRLRVFAQDPKMSSADRGWFKQELNRIHKSRTKILRPPPGKNLAHPRGFEAAKGFDHSHSLLQNMELHSLQHKHDNGGLNNKTPFNIKPVIYNSSKHKYFKQYYA